MPTLFDFFAPTEDDIARALQSAARSPQFAAAREFASAVAGPISSTVQEEIKGALDMSIPGLLARAWSAHADVKKHLMDDASSSVPLLDHTIETKHSPYIQASRNNMPLFRIHLSVKLEVAIQGLVLSIRSHRIQQIAAGKFTGSGTLSLEGIPLVEKKSKPIDIPGSYAFRHEDELALAAAAD